MGFRALAAIMAAASTAAAIVVSCADPYAGADPGVASAEGGGDGAGEAEVDGSGMPPAMDAGPLADVVTIDGARVDAASCASTDCDCDHDGFPRASCGGSGTDAAVVDCDDLDPSRHPGQDFVASVPPPGQTPPGDWNCDGVVEKAFSAGITCTTTGSGVCATTQGFAGDPRCGVEDDFVTCKTVAIVECAEATRIKRTQGCR
jgi:hypothetical protein